MQKKTIAGLITTVAIVAAVIFAGCVEEEAPTKVPETTPAGETLPSKPELKYSVGDILKAKGQGPEYAYLLLNYDGNNDSYQTTVVQLVSDKWVYTGEPKKWNDRDYYEETLGLVKINYIDTLDTVTLGKIPGNIIPLSVEGFKFVEKSEVVGPIFDDEEYSAYSFFYPLSGSEFENKVESLSIDVHRFEDEKSADETCAALAELGTAEKMKIQIDSIKATLTYSEDHGEASIIWQEGRLIIWSLSSAPYDATTFDEQVLKDAAINGAKAVAEKLQGFKG
ncbi:MAG TPA: hypothetical protein C5S37_02640 [Methanophagales archaeon]|nr:hypothetical protein [Methanophagales archaeon]